jgi:5-methylcytosine-specific restriction protein A
VLVPRGRCATHATQQEHTRGNYALRRWYRQVRWFHLRRQVLLEQAYTCAQCGQVQHQLEIDHIQPHAGNPALFFNRHNLQALCPPCHGRKTRREEAKAK